MDDSQLSTNSKNFNNIINLKDIGQEQESCMENLIENGKKVKQRRMEKREDDSESYNFQDYQDNDYS